MNKLKVGIVGFGKIGQIRYSILKNNPKIIINSICEKKDIKVKSKSITIYNSFRSFIKSDIDIVFISTFNQSLSKYTLLSLQNNKHVFCEKPGAENLKDFYEIKKILKKKRLKIKYGFNHRYHESVIAAKKIIESKKYGKLVCIRGIYGKPGGIDYNLNWRNFKKFSGGGILLDQGIHMLDLINYLSKENFFKIKSFQPKKYWNIENEDNIYAIMKSKNGVVASIHSSATQWKHKFLLEFIFSKGYITLSGLNTPTGSYKPEKILFSNVGELKNYKKIKEKSFTYTKDRSWDYEINEFINSILYKKKIKNGTIDDAINTLATIKKIYKSK